MIQALLTYTPLLKLRPRYDIRSPTSRQPPLTLPALISSTPPPPSPPDNLHSSVSASHPILRNRQAPLPSQKSAANPSKNGGKGPRT